MIGSQKSKVKSQRHRSLLLVLAFVALTSSAWAQFGHPLAGQWSGEWGPAGKPNRVLLNLDWDGKAITGAINPGPNAATVRTVTFDYTDPSAWVVKLEAEGKDGAKITMDGRLENIGAYRKIFRGTWMQGSQKAPFSLTRN
jgi:hypothetical protein